MIADLLVAMLRENTGRHLADSGGYPQYDEEGNYTGSTGGYGRNFERNQNTDFDSEPPITFEFSSHGVSFVLSTYHWLKHRLKPSPTLQGQFKDWAANNPECGWLQLMEEFIESLEGVQGASQILNTYNGPSALSQDIQYMVWQDHQGTHVLLQIHNGMDPRGGYTKPRVFDLDGPDSLDGAATARMSCSECDATWDTDDDYNWYARDDGERWEGSSNSCPRCQEGELQVA